MFCTHQSRNFSGAKAHAYKFPMGTYSEKYNLLRDHSAENLIWLLLRPADCVWLRAQRERVELFSHRRSIQRCLCRHPRVAVLPSTCSWRRCSVTDELPPWTWCKYGQIWHLHSQQPNVCRFEIKGLLSSPLRPPRLLKRMLPTQQWPSNPETPVCHIP